MLEPKANSKSVVITFRVKPETAKRIKKHTGLYTGNMLITHLCDVIENKEKSVKRRSLVNKIRNNVINMEQQI